MKLIYLNGIYLQVVPRHLSQNRVVKSHYYVKLVGYLFPSNIAWHGHLFQFMIQNRILWSITFVLLLNCLTWLLSTSFKQASRVSKIQEFFMRWISIAKCCNYETISKNTPLLWFFQRSFLNNPNSVHRWDTLKHHIGFFE